MILTQEMKASELKQGRPREPHVHFIANRAKEKQLIEVLDCRSCCLEEPRPSV